MVDKLMYCLLFKLKTDTREHPLFICLNSEQMSRGADLQSSNIFTVFDDCEWKISEFKLKNKLYMNEIKEA